MMRFAGLMLVLGAFAAGLGAQDAPVADLPALERAVQQDPGSYDARHALARALVGAGRHDEAMREYDALLARFPGDADALLARGRLHAWARRHAEAEADLTAVTARFPDYADAWLALGDLRLWTDRPNDAAEAYGRAAEASPADPAPRIARAKARLAAGDPEGAKADLAAARERGGDAAVLDALERDVAAHAGRPAWRARLFSETRRFAHDRTDWQVWGAAVEHRFDGGSLSIEGTNVRRFRQEDDAVAVEAYADLWSGAYARLRFQYAPDADVLPETDGTIEVTQAIAGGWEAWANFRHLHFPDSDPHVYGVGVGKYLGDWYLRASTTFAPGPAELGRSHTLSIRRLLGSPDDFVEVTGGFGNEVVSLDARAETEERPNRFVALSAQKFLTGGVGLTFGAEYRDEENAPESVDLSFGMVFRW